MTLQRQAGGPRKQSIESAARIGTYPDALLDKVVLVSSQLGLKADGFGEIVFLCLVRPVLVEPGLWLVGCDDSQALPGITVALDILALLCLDNGSFQGIDSEDDGGSADEEKTGEASPAYIGESKV